jgi:phosphopantetheine adenylyltransferase
LAPKETTKHANKKNDNREKNGVLDIETSLVISIRFTAFEVINSQINIASNNNQSVNQE